MKPGELSGAQAITRPGDPSRTSWRDAALLLALLGLALTVRWLTLPTIDAGGDALLKWHQSKVALGLASGEWTWSHHTARLGIMGPILAVQAALGTGPVYYYVPPLAMFLLQIALVFRVGLRLRGRALGGAAAVFLIVFPQMQTSGAQLLPGVFSGTYITAALLCLVWYRDAPERAPVALGLCAVALWLAYLTKLSNLFFLPGAFGAAWLWRRHGRDVGYLIATTVGLMLIEAGALSAVTGHTLGRFGMIQAAHAPMAALDSPFELLERYANLPASWVAVLAAYGGAAAGVLVAALRGRASADVLAVVLVPGSFLLGLTLAVRSLDPLIPGQAYNARYLTAVAPLLALAVGLCVAEGRSRLVPARGRPGISPTAAAAGVAVALALVGAWHYAVHFQGLAAHPLTRLATYRDSVALFERGMPVVGDDPRGLGVRAWLMLLWDDPAPAVRQLHHPGGGIWVAFAPGHERSLEELQGRPALRAVARRHAGSDSYSFELSRIRLPDLPNPD